jgi:leader peptidase (prepilin peptidase)/N-methyltransferase
MILDLHILPTWFLILVLILISACIGSFLNVVIYRLPLMLDNENISLSRPRSACPSCKHMIAWYDNIPVISYFLLHAACRHCHQKISWRYPVIEFSTILLSLAVYFILGLHYQMLAGLLFTWWLIAMTMIDFDHFLLPDQLTLSLLWLGLLLNIQNLFSPLSDAVIGAALGYSLLWLINGLYKAVRKKDGMGQGDWKLAAAFGAWFGWFPLFYILAAASFIGAIVGLMAIINKKAKLETALPFGPFLCIGAWLWLLMGSSFV